MTLNVTFVMLDGSLRRLSAEEGQTLLDVARANKIDEIEGACGGVMACATCHVIIDKDWFGKLPPATDDEMDMMDLAHGVVATSRLGCQIRLTEAMDGLIVRLPK